MDRGGKSYVRGVETTGAPTQSKGPVDNRNADLQEVRPLPSPLISARALADLLPDDGVVIVDCRFSLGDPEAGHRRWMQSRIPGAFYAHLDRDLSLPVGDGSAGRHPLPGPDHVHALLAAWGVEEDSLMVIYDDAGGGFASRLWWMARWIGHDGVCVLDGGWPAWLNAGGPVEETEPRAWTLPDTANAPSASLTARTDLLASADELLMPDVLLVDARARPRYLGETEPIDRVAGHIPGAVNVPWMDNLAEDGTFRSPTELAARWHALGGSEHAVAYCGSGVTACHNILAAAAAGLPMPRLYAPSWSGWISDPSRGVETGEPG